MFKAFGVLFSTFAPLMWYRIAALVIKYRVALMVMLLAATAFMGYHASKVQLSYEFTNAIPTDNPGT